MKPTANNAILAVYAWLNRARIWLIFNELISPDVVQNIDYLISIINPQTLGKRIPLDVIIMLERRIKGVKSKGVLA